MQETPGFMIESLKPVKRHWNEEQIQKTKLSPLKRSMNTLLTINARLKVTR